MKLLKLFSCSLLLFAAFTFSTCKKDNTNTESQLPPETTTGAMTFGCKVDGKVFVPKDGNGKPGLFVQYVNLGNVPDGGWHLNIPAINWQSDKRENINISTDSLLVQEGTTYVLKNERAFAQAFYEEVNSGSVIVFSKLDNDSGYLKIKKFDQINHIISGTFSFIGTNSNGEKMNITEGRFDVKY